MEIIISTISRFHAFSLAEQLQKRGLLNKLIVSYFNPKKNAKGYNIDKAKVVNNIFPLAVAHLPNIMPILKPWKNFSQYIGYEFYDLWARTHIKPCDIFVGWSSLCLQSLRKAKRQGGLAVVERGSTHMLFQKEILEEEYGIYGIRKKMISDRVLNKELKEYEESDYIFIPSTFVRKTFIEKGVPEKKLIQIPYGVSLDHFRPVLKKDKVFRVIHIGGNLRKGTHYLLQAMKELKLKNAELMLIGPIEETVKPFVQEYRGNIKTFTKIPHLELYKYYSQGSVYVLPSIEEGLAMAQAEALACGLPVICSRNTGGEDIIRDGVEGFVVPIRNVEALKNKILYLYEHEKKRNEMRFNAIERAKEFSWQRYGDSVVEAYKKILGSERM